METTSQLKHIRISAQKCRLIADQIRGMPVNKALNQLIFSNKKAADAIKKVLESAIANAEHNEGADIDELKISKIYIDEAAVQKRWRPRARGRADQILKRSSHITVAVSDE